MSGTPVRGPTEPTEEGEAVGLLLLLAREFRRGIAGRGSPCIGEQITATEWLYVWPMNRTSCARAMTRVRLIRTDRVVECHFSHSMLDEPMGGDWALWEMRSTLDAMGERRYWAYLNCYKRHQEGGSLEDC